ncbi:DegT/DnrJ/EryC1/StrS family aminotransferase [Patescibacteria group bacterium]|nr:DegT/DnrJ/EryC1/StrS family aminotransferase [Patescibacteria group bacterium]
MYKIPLSKPDITNSDRQEVLKVLKTNFLSLGPKLKEFEKKIAKFAGVKYAVGVNSGTAALHLIIKTLNIKKGDEVITTSFSFISSSNCILYEGAKPVFVDIDEKTLNINPAKIAEKITSKTKAILAVDIFGRSADWDKLEEIAKKHKLFLIEDSAEALGSEYKGKKCGSFGNAGIFSFYPNKQITAGEGGMILTNNKDLADLCRSIANQGRKAEGGRWLEHIRMGYNYRLNEMSAALGLSQLERIKKIIKKREKIVKLYNQKLKNVKGIKTPALETDKKISWFVYVVKLAKNLSGGKRDKIISEMAKGGIQCSNYFYPIHLQPFYMENLKLNNNQLPVTEDIGKRTLALPFFNNITEKEINFVVRNLKEIIRTMPR